MRYVTALTINEGPVPKASMRTPESTGPINLPIFIFAEFKLVAFGKSFSPTKMR